MWNCDSCQWKQSGYYFCRTSFLKCNRRSGQSHTFHAPSSLLLLALQILAEDFLKPGLAALKTVFQRLIFPVTVKLFNTGIPFLQDTAILILFHNRFSFPLRTNFPTQTLNIQISKLMKMLVKNLKKKIRLTFLLIYKLQEP